MKEIAVILLLLLASPCFSQQQKLSVYFDYNKYEINGNSKQQLDSLLAKNNNQINKISLAGFCDKIGNDDYNDNLSLQRTNAVKQYLISKEISERDFVNDIGFGKRKPVNDNATAEQRQLNRRVEILFSILMEIKSVVPPPDTVVITTLERKITDTSTKAGDNIVLQNLNFIGGRHLLVETSKPILQELLQVMQKYPSLKIEIQGHICCVFDGRDGLDFDTNQWNLSLARAKAVRDFLLENGIDISRLSYKGFSSKQPIYYPERNAQQQAANRRVEIKIIAK